ncbi:MAG: hypothetical protein II840_09480, partial [Kiritimatiellae bacterium]|nr:hypothetical protein [Kiritimatiellia bacterium]
TSFSPIIAASASFGEEAMKEMNPFLLRSIHVLPKQQRPLQRLVHCAASILRFCRHTLEYPQFLTLETGRMPDSIGRDAFSEVK